MNKHIQSTTVRRSIAVPRKLLEEVENLAPAEAASNWNRLVITALEDYASRKRSEKLQREMAEMAADPAIRKELKSINRQFQKTERDGLK